MIQNIGRGGLDLPYCPNCGKGVNEDFNYCPECGYRIVGRFNSAVLAEAFGSVDTGERREHTHRLAQEKLREIGTKYRLRTTLQYYKSGTALYPHQLTVVLWLDDSKTVAAFIIQPKKRNLGVVGNHYDVEKLADTDAQVKFIANVSRMTGKAYFHKLLENGTIEYAPVPEEVYSYKLEDIKKIHPRAYDPWMPEEDDALVKEFKQGIPISELARIHQRKIGAIEARLAKLGLIPPQSWQNRRRAPDSQNKAQA
jgi:hypothetical protein